MPLVERDRPLQSLSGRKERRASMARTHIRHRVEGYSKWKEVFDSTAEYKRSHGWKGHRIHAIEGDNNHLLVMEEFETEDQIREALRSDYVREAMGRAGVSDEPDIQVVELLEEGSA
jgi:uncharacterized protein (DUF1330 family)